MVLVLSLPSLAHRLHMVEHSMDHKAQVSSKVEHQDGRILVSHSS